jgi:hypothetical protein
VRAGVFTTPRPLPNRVAPALAGTAVVVLALPVLLVAGWSLAGWALAAVLWAAGEGLGLVLTRLRLGPSNLAASGVVGIGMMFRAVAVMIVVIAVAAADPELGLAAGLVYAAAYTLELGLSLASYFGAAPR